MPISPNRLKKEMEMNVGVSLVSPKLVLTLNFSANSFKKELERRIELMKKP